MTSNITEKRVPSGDNLNRVKKKTEFLSTYPLVYELILFFVENDIDNSFVFNENIISLKTI